MPKGAFYYLLDVTKVLNNNNSISNSDELCEFLLEKHCVAVIPGSAFGIENHIRLSFTAPLDQVEKGIERILRGISELVD